MKRTLTAIAAAAALGLTACAAGPADSAPPENAPSVSQPPAAPSAVPIAGTEEATVLAFGETWTYPDGLEVTAGIANGERTNGDWVGADGMVGYFHRVPVTVRNNGSQIVDLSAWEGSMTANGAEAPRVLDDYDRLYENTGEGRIEPGETVDFELGYAHLEFDRVLTYTFTPGPDYPEATFHADEAPL